MRLTGLLLTVLLAAPALAGPITITVGDNDGYGFGVLDNDPAFWSGPGGSGELYDGRSVGEAIATNGAQFTDLYAALYPSFGANTTTSGDVIFPLGGNTFVSATFMIDMADFQLPGTVTVSFNGVVQPGLLDFDDGFHGTRVRTFALSPAALANANAAGQFVVHLQKNDTSPLNDLFAFDYFQLNGETTHTPEPATLAVFGGIALAGALGYRRRKATSTG